MHSAPLDSNGSPRKRTLSRGISEDESLRSIINETEGSSRRLTRSESRTGTLKRTSDNQQSDQDLFMGLPEMLELQASYDEVVQELRGLEVEREALLFQVDVLQDTLESVEELLAEAQREAGQASVELEREKEAKRKLESMVCSLVEEVERLKEERNNKASAQAIAHGVDDEVAGQQGQKMKSAACSEENDSLQGESSGKEAEEDDGSVLTKLRKMVSKPLIHVPSLALENPVSLDGVFWRPYQNGVEEAQDASADQNDSDSAYEDASADTPEQDRLFPGEADPPELQHDSEIEEKCSVSNNQDDKTQDPKPNEQCVVS